jgi:hypothetical protein
MPPTIAVCVTIQSHLSEHDGRAHVLHIPSGSLATGSRFGFVRARTGSTIASVLMRPAAAPCSNPRRFVEVHVFMFGCFCRRIDCTLPPMVYAWHSDSTRKTQSSHSSAMAAECGVKCNGKRFPGFTLLLLQWETS